MPDNIPRKGGAGGNASAWKAVTKYALGSRPFVATGDPGNIPTTTFAAKQAGYKILSLRDGVTKEDMAAGQGFEDVQARVTTRALMKALMLEELSFLGGNVTALGAVTGLAAAAVASVGDTTDGGSAWTNVAWYFNVVPVTVMGLEYLRSLATPVSVLYPKDYNGTDALMAAPTTGPTITTGTALGIGTYVGAPTNVTATPATTGGVRLTWAPLAGAAAYIIFHGTTNDATVAALGVVAQTAVTLTSRNTTAGSALSVFATDNSGDSLAYDGILSQLAAAGSGAYIRNLRNKLSQSGGEIVEIQDALAGIYNNTKVGEHWILVGAQEQRTITKLGVAAGGGPTLFVDPNAAVRATLTQGYRVKDIYNGSTGEICSVIAVPWLPGGTIIIIPKSIPYDDANQGSPFDWMGGYDCTRFDYPMTPTSGGARAYPFEVACWGVLRGVFTGGCGLITGVLKS